MCKSCIVTLLHWRLPVSSKITRQTHLERPPSPHPHLVEFSCCSLALRAQQVFCLSWYPLPVTMTASVLENYPAPPPVFSSSSWTQTPGPSMALGHFVSEANPFSFCLLRPHSSLEFQHLFGLGSFHEEEKKAGRPCLLCRPQEGLSHAAHDLSGFCLSPFLWACSSCSGYLLRAETLLLPEEADPPSSHILSRACMWAHLSESTSEREENSHKAPSPHQALRKRLYTHKSLLVW